MNIGDKVLVTGPEGWTGERQEYYINNNEYTVAPSMYKYKGKETTICAKYHRKPDTWLLHGILGFYWHESWLQPIETIQLSDEIFDILEE